MRPPRQALLHPFEVQLPCPPEAGRIGQKAISPLAASFSEQLLCEEFVLGNDLITFGAIFIGATFERAIRAMGPVSHTRRCSMSQCPCNCAAARSRTFEDSGDCCPAAR